MKIKLLVYGLVFAVAVPLVAVQGFLLVSWQHDSRDHAMATLKILANATADNLQSRLIDTQASLRFVAERSGVGAPDPDRCNFGMRILRDADPALSNIAIYDRDGTSICTAVPSPGGAVVTVSDTDWFSQVMRENRLAITDPYVGRYTGLLTSLLAYPVRDANDRPIGAATITLRLAKLLPDSMPLDQPGSEKIVVVNREGFVLASQPHSAGIGLPFPETSILDVARATTEGVGFGKIDGSTDVVFAFKTAPLAGWIALVYQPIDEVFAHARTEGIDAAVVGVGSLAIVLLIAMFIVRALMAPLDRIVSTVRAVASGNRDIRMPLSDLEEFETVARQFNDMLDVRADAERRIVKLNRMYAALSETNQTITKNTDRKQILEDVCRIVVDHGGFALVWIGFHDTRTGLVVSEAHYGPASGYMDGLNVALDPDDPIGRGPTARAIRGGRPEVVSDVTSDNRSLAWREGAKRYGFHSTGAFPLRQDGACVGAINLYATERDYFDDPDLMALISEIAEDVSFALDALRVAAARRDSESRFRQITENIREVFWLTDPAKNVMLYISPAYRDIWGRSVEELYAVPQTWIDSIHPDDRDRIVAALKRQAEGGYDEEYRIVRPDGDLRWIHDRAVPIRDAAGNVYRIAGVADDITRRKQAEDSLRRSEASLANAQAIARLGNWERDLVTEAGYWSDEMYRMFNRSPSLGPPSPEEFMEYVDPADRPKHLAAVRRVRESGEEVSVEFRGNVGHGMARWYRTVMAPAIGAEGQVVGLVGTVLDVTDIKEAEQRLVQAQKMEALGIFAGGIAHDFNNMLLPILNLTEHVQEDIPKDHPAQASLSIVIKAANQARNLVNQILNFSRPGEHSLIVLDIAAGVAEAVTLLRNALPPSISISEQIDPRTGFVAADPAELHSVILNLGSNAAHAIGERGGTLTIGVSRMYALPEFRSRYPDLTDDDWFAKIVMTDTGEGMDSATVAKMFTPFFTTKKSGQGTGLGLAMVHAIVVGLGGAIEVQSQVGLGTTLTIYLPLTGQPPE